MRKIVHLSDLHFGRIDAGLLEPLVEAVNAARPTLVVVSGDLTQRARSHQFEEARAFLDRLPFPQVVVPGNHDVPLYDVVERFARPLDKWRRFISEEVEPVYEDEEMVVVGRQHGALADAQVRARQRAAGRRATRAPVQVP